MSNVPPKTAPSSGSNFQVIFENALKGYQKTTKQDLTVNPLFSQLQECDSPAAILTILQDQVDQFIRSRSGDERLKNWLYPTISVLYAFSATLGGGVGLVFPPANAIFAGAGALLLAAKDVESSQDVLINVFERIGNFFRRLEIYTDVPPTPAMTEMMVKIMIEVLDIFGTATKEMKQSRAKKFLNKVAGITKLEDDLKRLDEMANEETRMANAEVLKIAHSIDKKFQGFEAQVKDVDKKVEMVNSKVQMVIEQTAYNLDDQKGRQLRKRLEQSPPEPPTLAVGTPSPGGAGVGAGAVVPTVRINGYGEYSGLLYHSPHGVMYEDDLYPTALHLYEALKYLKHRPDLADRIRLCEHVEEVVANSALFADHTRRDWLDVALATMDEVLYIKFRQHGDLRALLLRTYPAGLIYVEADDLFWGDGAGAGLNELGKSLMRVRERISHDTDQKVEMVKAKVQVVAAIDTTQQTAYSSNPFPTPPQERRDPYCSLPPPQQRKPPPGTYSLTRRFGFWNRRGDHLTHDKYVVYAPPDRVNPRDLENYPPPTEGYMDHYGTFIRYDARRMELPESLPHQGCPPKIRYEKFVTYIYL